MYVMDLDMANNAMCCYVDVFKLDKMGCKLLFEIKPHSDDTVLYLEARVTQYNQRHIIHVVRVT